MPDASSQDQVGRDFVKSFRGAFAQSKFRNLQLSDSVATPLGQLSDVIDRLLIVAAGEWFHTNGKWFHIIASHVVTWLLENNSTQMGNDLTSKPQGKRDELAEF